MFTSKYKKARTLRRNGDGINVLLEGKGDAGKSILQLRDDEILRKLFPDPEETDRVKNSGILPFLDSLDWNLTNESGAEYKYYKAELPLQPGKLGKRIYDFFAKLFQPTSMSIALERVSFDATLIEPASQRQLSRMSTKPSFVLVQETKEVYAAVTQAYIQEAVGDGKSLAWIFNVIDGEKEVDRVLFQNDAFLLNIDTKWRSHPDVKNTPRSEWKDHPSTVDLYCLALFKESGVASLRDLRAAHLPVLKDILTQGLATIEEIYGVSKEEVRVFVHYLPQFYHFHVHFTRLFNSVGCSCDRAHLLQSVINNLEEDPLYYAKANLYFTLPKDHLLVTRISQKHGN